MLATIDPWILSFSAITVAVTIWMGFRSAKTSKTASDFFVAGRSVGVGMNASAISGEYLSAASFMGVAGMVMSSGYDALWYPVCYACGYLFLLLFIAGPLRRFGAYTIPDFAEGRFDSPLFRKIAVVFVLFIGFFYTMPQMKGAGTTLAYIFPGLPYWAGVVLVGAVITLNVALGGMKGITLVQAFQYWAKMFAISVPIFVLMAVYGHYGKQLNAIMPQLEPSAARFDRELVRKLYAPRTINEILNKDLNWAAKEGPTRVGLKKIDLWPQPTSMTLDTLLFQYAYWFKGMEPFKIYRARELHSFGIVISQPGPLDHKDFTEHIQSVLATNGIVFAHVTADVIKVYPSAKASTFQGLLVEEELSLQTHRKILPENAPADSKWLSPFGPLTTKAATAAGIKGDDAKPYSLLYTYSLIIALVCGTAGLPHILVRFYTNPDGVAAKRTTMWVMILIGVFYVFPPVFGVIGRNLMPELYEGIGAKGTDKVVLELPTILGAKYGILGSILSGITCAGAFAAFMSTFSGLLVSMTGALAHDIYGRILRPKATAEQRLRMFKIGAVIIGGVAILLGMQVEALQINFMVGQAFAIAAASYFPLLFMAVWWRKLTMKGAAAGMLTGGICALAAVTLTNFSDLAAAPKASAFFQLFAGMNPFWAANPLLRILCEQPAIWTVPLAIGLMIVVSKLTAKEVPADIRMKMLVLHAPEKLGLKQEYIQEHQHGH